MATWVIGDVHGCFATLSRLLDRIRYERRRDRLWMVGDLVNRGPRSLEVLRWAAGLGDKLVTVLGNHDLHLLARARGLVEPRRRDTLDEVLAARDGDDLLAWLLARPLFHRDGDWTLVHAGLFPAWTLSQAERLARDTEAVLQGKNGDALLRADRKVAERWDEGLGGIARARAALAGFARLRTLMSNGRMCPDFSGTPDEAPDGCAPWFERPRRSAGRGNTVIFGHWAALGLYRQDGVVCLDSGAAWGRALSAIRLDDGAIVQQQTVD